MIKGKKKIVEEELEVSQNFCTLEYQSTASKLTDQTRGTNYLVGNQAKKICSFCYLEAMDGLHRPSLLLVLQPVNWRIVTPGEAAEELPKVEHSRTLGKHTQDKNEKLPLNISLDASSDAPTAQLLAWETSSIWRAWNYMCCCYLWIKKIHKLIGLGRNRQRTSVKYISSADLFRVWRNPAMVIMSSQGQWA